MTRFRTALTACGLSLLLLAAATGCGGGDDKKEAAPPTSAQVSGPTTTLAPVDTRFTGQGSTEFCNLARTYTERFGKVDPKLSGTQLRTLTQEGLTALNQAAGAAPAEIKTDVQVIANVIRGLVAELDRVNYDYSKVSPDSLSKLQAPDFAASTQRFQAYMTNVCKITS